ncbi:Lipid A export permease/ATP-binding protein MsbA [hydrothermal vent metagenome]|uniref:Lipid A export permease/ATP-binding protein MsbA n=1 Tax=hydrothermal vent metagenome TaxID=652676 RepID=A0A3B0ZWT0_9ZZZZ
MSKKNNSANSSTSGIKIYRRLLSHVIPYWKVFVFSVCGMVVYSVTDAAFAYLMKPLLDDGFVKQDPTIITWLPIFVILIFTIRMFSGFISTYFMNLVARNVIRDLRKLMFNHIIDLPVPYFDNSSPGKITAKLVYDVEQLASAASSVITIVIRDSLSVIVLLAWMVYLSPMLTAILLITTPLLAMLILFVSKRFRKISHRIQGSMGDVSHVVEETITGNRVVKMFGGQKYERQQFDKINSYNRKQQLKLEFTNSISTPFIQLILSFAFAFIIYMATTQSDHEVISAGTFVSFLTAMIALMQPIKRITNVNSKIQIGIAAAQSVFEFIDSKTESDSGLIKLNDVQGQIVFKNINFSYGNDDKLILNNINLDIKAHQSIAFVGQSGSGKSTLLSLLPRFYNINQGEISLDGVNINDISIYELRKYISLVSQNVTLFNDTVEHNIAYGALESASKEDIINAAKAAHAMEFIEKLPDGMQTHVGDNGALLSGGQRQRIAIARAILKNAPILILDEATSALDTSSERHIQAALKTLMKDRTTLVIAHRLSTIEYVDKIVVIDEGRIAEYGTHKELLKEQGIYANLYELQFAND